MNDLYSTILASPIGPLRISVDNEGTLHRVDFLEPGEGGEISPPAGPGSALLEKARRELDEYFSGRRTAFEMKVEPSGTPFHMRVWEAMMRIPYGETRTYGELAAMAGNPKAARAVGLACGANPIPVVIPCHRVVASGGKLGGFGGGIERKIKLLELERKL